MPPPSESFIQKVRSAHIKQLGCLKVDYENRPSDEEVPHSQDDVNSWINDNEVSINQAQTDLVRSSTQTYPNWDCVLFALIESGAVYLRKENSMIAAIEAARRGDVETAEKHILSSQSAIDAIAAQLGCTFIQVCDFSTQSPSGTSMHSGAYCGMFISNSAGSFVGIAFKGTTKTNLREVNTDFDWKPSQGLMPGAAFGAEIHRGFNYGLFGTYATSTASPMQLISAQIAELVIEYTVQNTIMGPIHLTGHSLGGAYCTLTYGELLRVMDGGIFLGDMYSFASPRVCLEPFASSFAQHLAFGPNMHAFRFVNGSDSVPTIPPLLAGQLVDYPYIHIDGGWQLQANAGPLPIPSEQPPNGTVALPQSVAHTIWNLSDHSMNDYYAGWQNTPHS